MKNFIKFNCFILLFFGGMLSVQASHLMGGEITWRITASGKFIFQVRLYRDCNGINAPPNVYLESNAPIQGVQCFLVQSNDLSPVGANCPDCQYANGAINAFQEYIYESDSVILSGIIPQEGWNFRYTDCCRNAAIVNLMPGSGNFVLRAVMYSLNGQPYPDNSPYFLYPPSLAVCAGTPVEYSHGAADLELDSLTYEWASALDVSAVDTFITFPYALGYNYTNPLADQSFNPLNIPAQLNTVNGQINFTSYSSGGFVTVVKVTSYKCGEKTAEIFREIQMTVVPDCIITFSPAVSNSNPVITVTHQADTSIIRYDTLLAGESASYMMTAYDFQIDSAGNMQNITLEAVSPHFGLNYSDPLIGCLIPPCATLQTPSVVTGTIMAGNQLNFISSCAHVGLFSGCLQHQRTYTFAFRATDDFCPVRGIAFQNLNITVHGPLIVDNGTDLWVSLPGATFQWYLNGVPIPGETDTIITPAVSGIYSVIATQPGGCELISNAVNRVFAGIEDYMNRNEGYLYVDQNSMLNIISSFQNTGTVNLSIFSMDGKLIKNHSFFQSVNPEHLKFDISGLSSGLYLVELLNSSEKQIFRFFLK